LSLRQFVRLMKRAIRFLDLSRRIGDVRDELAVFYGDFISSNVAPTGGKVKFFRLAEYLPQASQGFNLVYLGSNTLPAYWRDLVSIAKKKGIPIVLNQNGVYSEGWYGSGWGVQNGPMRELNHLADFVIYQSKFCQRSAEQFFGLREGPSTVLHNAVDTRHFKPLGSVGAPEGDRPLRLLVSGSQYQDFPVKCSVATLGEIRRHGVNSELLIAGSLSWAGSEEESRAQLRKWCVDFDVHGHVRLLGRYTQADAPGIHHQADILLQAKYNDSCPSAVVEALACGIPIVYSASGGTTELVGTSAGIGVAVEQSWTRMIAPDPKQMATAALSIYENLDEYSAASRELALKRYDLQDWVANHLRIFEELKDAAAS